MPDQRPLGQQHQTAACCTHVSEIKVGLTSPMDLAIGFVKGIDDRRTWIMPIGFQVVMPHRFGRQTTGDLTGGVCPHAIGDQEKMSMMTPGTGRFSQHAGDKILIVAAAHPRFAEGRDANTRCRRTTAQVRTTGTVRMRGGRQSTGISQEPFSKAKAVARKPPLTPLARCFILEENGESIPSRN